jgi:hypothetical protein
VGFAEDVALEAAEDVAFGQAFCGASLQVGAGSWAVARADDGDDVQSSVGLPVSAFVEAVSGGSSGGCFEWGDTAEAGEGGFAVESVGVVAGGDE